MADLILPRRKFLLGLVSLVAAPAVVRAASLMPVRRVLSIQEQANSVVKFMHDNTFVTVFKHDRSVLTLPYAEGMQEVMGEIFSYGEAMYRTPMTKDEFRATYLEGLQRNAVETG